MALIYTISVSNPKSNASVTKGGTLSVIGYVDVYDPSSSTSTIRPGTKRIYCQFGSGYSSSGNGSLSTMIGTPITVTTISSSGWGASGSSGSAPYGRTVDVPDSSATNGSSAINGVKIWIGSSTTSIDDYYVIPLTQTGGGWFYGRL